MQKKRIQFGRPIGKFQAIKHKIADIKIFYETARLLAYRIAWCKDQGRPLNHLEAAVAKLYVGDYSLGPQMMPWCSMVAMDIPMSLILKGYLEMEDWHQ